MAENSPDADALGRLLTPYAELIQQCFDRSLTVEQCAEYLAFSRDAKESLPLEWLSSPSGVEAIQDVFWNVQRDEPLVLFEKVLGGTCGRRATMQRRIKVMAARHPFFLSWVPAAALGR